MEADIMRKGRRPGWDVFLLAIVVFAGMQILAFGETAVPQDMRLEDVSRHPLLGNILPELGRANLSGPGPRPAEPLALILQATTLGMLILYGLVDIFLNGHWQLRLKWILLGTIILTALYLPTTKFILLREIRGPASYTHDGGVIQTEATIQFLLEGKNPYVEDYTETPMAEWGFSEYRTALYHYPYLPWTFIFSAPFYLLGNFLGLFDQRFVYLFLLTIMLFVVPRLSSNDPSRLILVMILALNPLMALDVLYGQNDVFVLCWIVFSLVCLERWQSSFSQHAGISSGGKWRLASLIFFGLACTSKPTAWFFAPFYGLLLVPDILSQEVPSRFGAYLSTLFKIVPRIVERAIPALIIFVLIMGPYVIWDANAIYDDVWRWSSGQGDTGYQIWGWGGSNFVLGLGLVEGRFAQWPFWLTEVLITLPLLLGFVWRQMKNNTIADACWHYGFVLLAFFYTSRFLNENYLAYILSFLAIGALADHKEKVNVQQGLAR